MSAVYASVVEETGARANEELTKENGESDRRARR